MTQKKIDYTSRDFNSIKNELIKFSKKYYPELSDTYNDASVGSWLIDLVSAVGDDLSYHIDKTFHETNVNSANLKSTVLNNARLNGVKVPGPKSSMCEIEISCIIPSGNDINGNISQPDWSYAPFISRGGIVSNGDSYFELTEDVNFAEQFNSDGVSNRYYEPNRDKNGFISSYTVRKTAIVHSGRSIVYKKIISSNEIKPFMEVLIPDKNVMNVESIIFKKNDNLTSDPEIQEYYIDEEEFKRNGDDNSTYRYFETNSLVDQYRLGSEMSMIDEGIIGDIYNPELYVDVINSGKKISRIYKNEWKPLKRKFITEYTDNGYLKIIFGANVSDNTVINGSTYAKNVFSNIMNNPMMGILPESDWMMYCLYRTGGGIHTNIAQGSINNIVNFDIFFKNVDVQINGDSRLKQEIKKSIKVTNKSVGVAGKDFPSVDEIKYITKYNVSAQDRCVTLKDYKVRLMSMPPKFGAPFRCNVAEENNKIIIPLLGVNIDGKLDSILPQTLVKNIENYLTHYKSINDYVEIQNGKIYNIGVLMDIFIDKNYNANNIISNVINKIKDYFDVNKHDMGDDIFIGDLEKEVTLIDGVISVINFEVYSITGNGYSSDVCSLPKKESGGDCNMVINQYKRNNLNCVELDIEQTDYVLYGDYNSMFEIKKPENDIQIRCKLK